MQMHDRTKILRVSTKDSKSYFQEERFGGLKALNTIWLVKSSKYTVTLLNQN